MTRYPRGSSPPPTATEPQGHPPLPQATPQPPPGKRGPRGLVPTGPARVTSLGIAGLGAWILATAGGQTLGIQALWPFHYLAYVPWELRLFLAAGVLAAPLLAFPYLRPCPPKTADRMGPGPAREGPVQALLEAIEKVQARPPLRWALHLGAMVLAGALFWALRERTWYGDALLKVHLLEQTGLDQDPYVWKEPLDALLEHTLSGLAMAWGASPAEAVAAISVAAGLLYLVAVRLLARHGTHTPAQAGLLAAGLLALGSSQLWFGHVENYSLSTALAYLTAGLAFAHHRGQAPLWAVGLAAGTAVAAHPQAAFTLLPLLLLLRAPKPQHRETRGPISPDALGKRLGILALSSLAVPAATVLVLGAAGAPSPFQGEGYAGDPQLFWTVQEALAPSQMWDALMNLWLLVPGLPVLAVAGLAATRDPDHGRSFPFRYASLLVLGLGIYHFGFQNDLPRPQDWDLFAIVGPGVALWGWLAWMPRAADSRAKRRDHIPTLLATLAFSLAITGSWIGVNHAYTLLQPDPDRRKLLERFRLLSLVDQLPQADYEPREPFCPDPSTDPTGCVRVVATRFTMPQDGDTRRAIFAHAPARIRFTLDVPDERTFLWLSPALDPLAWDWGGDGVTFQVWVRPLDGEAQLLAEQHLDPTVPEHRDWQELWVPLDAFRGRRVELTLATLPGPAGDASADRAGWGLGWWMRGTPRP